LASASSSPRACISSPAIGCEGAMSFELILGGVISAGMLVYLIFALLRPEKF
jgi:K+-transporting ATPase KdpF subunit